MRSRQLGHFRDRRRLQQVLNELEHRVDVRLCGRDDLELVLPETRSRL